MTATSQRRKPRLPKGAKGLAGDLTAIAEQQTLIDADQADAETRLAALRVVQATLNAEIAAIEKARDQAIQDPEATITALVVGDVVYVTAHWPELTDHPTLLELPEGTIRQREAAKGHVVLADTEGEAEMIALLESMGRKKAVRTKKELNRDLILADPSIIEGIPGISVGRTVTVFLVPKGGREVKMTVAQAASKLAEAAS